ncbi:MAG TPA: ASCH domain-containing protein [Nonomuraea sp.]|nr:ASCH domain-containing protein [Nonomuraea sp.]
MVTPASRAAAIRRGSDSASQSCAHRHRRQAVQVADPRRQGAAARHRRYLDLVAAGRKTIEVRVQYPNLHNLAAGDHIRFVCGRDDALTRVKRVSRYASFEEMLDAEGPANVNRDSPREQQLANIRPSTARKRKRLACWPSRSNSSSAPPHNPSTPRNGSGAVPSLGGVTDQRENAGPGRHGQRSWIDFPNKINAVWGS